MEYWSFPPSYDPHYLPDRSSRYWFPRRETMPPEERNVFILERLKEITRYAYQASPFYRNKWHQAGFHPEQLKTLEDFEERVPVITKRDLRQAQARAPSFGDYLCIPEDEIFHIHGTSGTTGKPTVFAIGRQDWQAIANAHARVMWGMGLRPGDTIFVASVFSLYMGSWGTLIGSERLGAKSFPFGAGAPGMSGRTVHWLHQIKPTAFYATPSYALHLAEVAHEEGLDPRDFELKILLFSGEPGASVPGVRDRIREAYGARVIDSGTMAEMSPWMSGAGAAQTDGMLLWQDLVYTEVCDPKTFCRVAFGERGTPVYTHLERTSQPMIRLLSGDLALWQDGPTPCGRTYPHLPNGIFGRIDDAFTVRGENVYPSEVDAALSGMSDYGGEHRIIITREGTMDELLVQIEADAAVYADGDQAMAGFRDRAAGVLQRTLGIRTNVEVVAANAFPRTDFKARRVIDDRDMVREMNARLRKTS
ncbi:MAG: phenylacetate--CoA ligase [Gammaproteobacteria bacterium]|nr:MAG: phenylacetate--CoA ligase [Gammaproteobacteria bacterium]